jgi:hypothetical protein
LEYADIERYLEAELYQEHASQSGYGKFNRKQI